MWSWGDCRFGQLGLGDVVCRLGWLGLRCALAVPREEPDGPRRACGAMAAGRHHTLFITASGKLLACGRGRHGALGAGGDRVRHGAHGVTTSSPPNKLAPSEVPIRHKPPPERAHIRARRSSGRVAAARGAALQDPPGRHAWRSARAGRSAESRTPTLRVALVRADGVRCGVHWAPTVRTARARRHAQEVRVRARGVAPRGSACPRWCAGKTTAAPWDAGELTCGAAVTGASAAPVTTGRTGSRSVCRGEGCTGQEFL